MTIKNANSAGSGYTIPECADCAGRRCDFPFFYLSIKNKVPPDERSDGTFFFIADVFA